MRVHASHAMFAIAVAGAALALGALHSVVLVVVALLLVGALLLEPASRASPLRPPAAALLLVAGALVVFTAFQSVPLPAGIGAVAWPHNASIWSRSLAPLGEPGPGWFSSSLDPTATRIEVLRGLVYLAVLALALRLAAERAGVVFLERLLVGSVVVMAFFALLHPALGATRVYGLYQPTAPIEARHIAPLLNGNHLAGYLNIGICLSAAIALSSQPHLPRAVAAATTLFLLGVEVWIGSRGGTLSSFVGLGLVVWMSRTHGAARSGDRSRPYALMGAVVLGAGVAVALLVVTASDEARAELTIGDVSKLRLFGQVMQLAVHSPIFGVGRGAFESAFPAFRTVVGDDTYTHPENLVGQWLAEWGLIVGPAALLVIAWSLRPRVALQRSRGVAGAWAALATIALHNQVDFSSEVPGVTMALAVCAAIVTGGSAGVSSRASRTTRWQRAAAALADRRVLVPLTVLASVACLVGLRGELDADRAAAREAVMRAPKDKGGFHALVAAAMTRHPAEPYFPYLGELRAQIARDESVVPWASAALERAPVNGRTHLVLARWLASRSPAQARFEYRLALQDNPPLWHVAATEGEALVHDQDDAMELAGNGPFRDAVLLFLSHALATRLPSTTEGIERELVRSGTPDLAPREALAADALDDVAEPAVWCETDRAPCLRLASDEVQKLATRETRTCGVDRLRARLLALQNGPRAARDALVDAIRNDPDGADCAPDLLLYLDAAGGDATDDVLRTTSRQVCPGPSCARVLAAFADFETKRGNHALALSLLTSALERGGADDEILASVARLSSAQGLHAQSADAYRKLALRHPEDAAWGELAEKERGEALRTAVMHPTLPVVVDAGTREPE